MTDDRDRRKRTKTSDEKKKKSTEGKQSTSEDLLTSLFNDLESTGQVDDFTLLINEAKNKKKAEKARERKSKDDKSLVADDKPRSSKSKSDAKEKKAKKKKSKKSDGKKSKSKKLKASVNSGNKSTKKRSRHSRSSSTSKRKHSPSARKRASRSRSPVLRKRSTSPTKRNDFRRVLTPPMYETKWNDFRSKFNWGQRHSRDNGGFLPWERDRWSRERSRSWSPNRYRRRHRSISPKARAIDERRIDKKELLALARKNATRLAMEGRLPKGVELGATLKNKSIRELIELCEEIQSRELEIAVPESQVVEKEDEYEFADFSTAPVRAASIKINLKDAASTTPKTNLERMIEENALRSHFPVSSGNTHKDKTDKITKEWVPVEIETPTSVEEGVVSSLSKKTVKIPTAYAAYKLSEEVKSRKPEPQPKPEPHSLLPFHLPFVAPLPHMAPPFLPPMPPMFAPLPPGFNSILGGYEAPEIINAAFLAPPPPPVFSSFDNPAKSLPTVSIPEPAPLTVISNADLLAQAEEMKREKQAEEELKAAIGQDNLEARPGVSSEETTVEIGGEGAAKEEQIVEELMEIEGSPCDEGVASPTPPPLEYKLPEGAILDKPVAPISIGGLVSRRARLVNELNNEPDNHQKRLEIADIDLKLSLWAQLKNETTAHFGAAPNMSYNVEPRPVINSIWATKDTLRNAPEFKGGIGEHLLKKMGWEPGQGLGRNMDGPVEPLTLDVKADRKGLYSTKDKQPPRREHAAVLNGNKNPVSAIMEHCAKNGLPPPLFLATEEGSTNNRRFGCKAILNGVEYDAATGATNKKAAKAQVALIMCQALGLK